MRNAKKFAEERIHRPLTPCWNWRAYCTKQGYGIAVFENRTRRAHRFVYELYVGPIPEGMELHHTCFNRSCVNPDHLVPIARDEHSEVTFVSNANKTHCKRGHEFTDENTYRDKKGRRLCRACKRDTSREAQRRKRGYYEHPRFGERTHCPQGHPYEGDNLILNSRGYKVCRACRNDRQRKPDGYVARGTHRLERTHCPHGHEYTLENTYEYERDGSTYRYCRECNREAARKRHARLKAAS